MKKRTLSIALAALTAFTLAVPAVVVNARDYDYIPRSAYRYASENVYGDAIYWYPNLEAYYQFNNVPPAYIRQPATPYSSNRFTYFDNVTGNYVDRDGLINDGVYLVTQTVNTVNGNEYVAYQVGSNGLYYPTEALARSHAGAKIEINTVLKNGTGLFFSIRTGNRYSTFAAAVTGSGGIVSNVMTYIAGQYYDYSFTPVYLNGDTNKYYLTAAEAAAAYKGATVTEVATPTGGYFFNRATGRFYLTEAYALEATKNEADVVRATSYAYGYGVYAPIVNTPSTGSSSSAAVSSGDAYLAANTSYKGWTSLANYINGRTAGADVRIEMNKQTSVPKSFFDAIQYRDADVTFENDNGSRFTINGADITEPKALNVDVTYSIKTIPSTAINKYADGALSASQMKIGDDIDFGLYAVVSVGFNASHAGRTVRLYYYNTETGKLSISDSSVVSTNGRASFSVRKGGNYCAIILK
ncbi:MAG: hypothetical protein LBL98_05250 [Ruminococcus sp.]|nr:hypothetical protein [Ruminococcus sp.]